MDINMNEAESKLIDQLNKVKTEFIKNKTELNFSIRKDVLAAELKDILENNASFYELKSALEIYINNLLDISER